MVERRDRPSLAPQALAHDRVRRDLGLDDLERDRSVEPQLTRAVENPDPTRPDHGLDLVSRDDRSWREH
jgi:hypothetical protein